MLPISLRSLLMSLSFMRCAGFAASDADAHAKQRAKRSHGRCNHNNNNKLTHNNNNSNSAGSLKMFCYKNVQKTLKTSRNLMASKHSQLTGNWQEAAHRLPWAWLSLHLPLPLPPSLSLYKQWRCINLSMRARRRTEK